VLCSSPASSVLLSLLLCPRSYVSGRRRKHGEVNGKSANLNNCLKVGAGQALC
jgi:hypothetical protein